jgi:ATP cone domain
VTSRSGASEPLTRDKVLAGVRKACQGRPVTEDDLALLAQRVEETVRASGVAEIEAHEVGMAVLPSLRELDEVAYLRFASVYRAFDALEAFEAEIALLRAERTSKEEGDHHVEVLDRAGEDLGSAQFKGCGRALPRPWAGPAVLFGQALAVARGGSEGFPSEAVAGRSHRPTASLWRTPRAARRLGDARIGTPPAAPSQA